MRRVIQLNEKPDDDLLKAIMDVERTPTIRTSNQLFSLALPFLKDLTFFMKMPAIPFFPNIVVVNFNQESSDKSIMDYSWGINHDELAYHCGKQGKSGLLVNKVFAGRIGGHYIAKLFYKNPNLAYLNYEWGMLSRFDPSFVKIKHGRETRTYNL